MTTIKTIISPIEQIGIIILICLISLTCLTSCGGGGGDDDLLTPQPEVQGKGGNDMVPITFGGKESEEATVTRAGTPLSDADVTSFNVWGHKDMSYSAGVYSDMQTVFPGYNVKWLTNSAGTTTSNTNGWEYVNQQTGEDEQTIKYWDWSAAAYRFFAATKWEAESAGPYVANKTYGAHGTYAAGAYATYEVTMLADASSKSEMDATPYFSHLWFSTGNADVYPDKQFGKPVTLEFLKPYARVRFIFKYVYPREGITLSEVSFKPTSDYAAPPAVPVKLARKGTFTVIYPLTGTETREWFTVTDIDADTRLDAFTEDFDPEDDTKEYSANCPEGWYTVLPNNTQGSYTMSVRINKSDPKTAVVPAEYMQWLPGYSYTYIFKITEEGGIEIGWVEYAMTPWTEMESTWTVYNW